MDEKAADTILTLDLRHGTGKDGRIVLAPQPSNDPNDPLNWPRWRKEACYIVLNVCGLLCASVTAPMLNTSIVILAGDFDVSVPAIVVVSGGYILLVTGSSGYNSVQGS